MFKMLKNWWPLLLLLVVAIVFYGDFDITKTREREVRDNIGGHDIMGAFAERLSPGMSRATAESLIPDFRQMTIFEAGGETTVTYRFWYGFIPPLPVLRYKTTGKISVTYSASGQVTEVKHWYY